MKANEVDATGHPQVDGAPVTVFIVSWGRPIYLWSCLDTLFRCTRSRANFVLLDNAHPDPMVGEVIRGFERRGMFSEVIRFPNNSWDYIRSAYFERLAGLGPYHVYMESDCVIGTSEPCWLAAMRRIMEGSPRLGMLGSLIQPEDFVPAEVARKLTGGSMQEAEFLAKLASPERGFIEDPRWADSQADYFLTDPPCPISNPPGRLMMLRTDAMLHLGLHLDAVLSQLMRDSGYLAGVTPRVRHRHLSLLNIFDYDGYEERQREKFFTGSS
jgi:hypothetical protein